MIKNLQVTNLCDNSFAFENVFLHNASDFDGKSEILLEFRGTIYRSLANGIAKGKIGIGRIQRNHYYLKLFQEIPLKEVTLEEKYLDRVTIKLSKLEQNSKVVSIHKDDFLKYLMNRFKSHWFSQKQTLVFDYHKSRLVGIVLFGDGFIDSNTDVDIVTDDVATLNVVDSSIISRDLFRDDFNFEEIGIGGLNNELANILRRALSSRAIKPSIIEKLGIKHVKGIILYGPPGTGKTLIARNIGKLLTKEPPMIINGPEILNKFVGQSEENLRKMFQPARLDYDANGENAQLYIFIFDEIDAICKKRGRSGTQSTVTESLTNQLLTLMDGVQSLPNIFLIAMTNRIDLIDDALLRPGRIEIQVEIGLPDREGRIQIFRIHTDKMKNNSMMGNINIMNLSERTENFSGAEIESVVKNASSFAIHELLTSDKKDIGEDDVVIEMSHFDRALDEIKPAFGNKRVDVMNLIPSDFKFLTDNYKDIYTKIMDHVRRNVRFRTMLIHGNPKAGKTVLVSKIALDSTAKYIKMVRPIDVMRFDECQKSMYLTDIAMDSYISESSLIIFDDIEVLMNFVDLGYNLSFSNKLYQTMLTILKTTPEKKTNSLTIICTTASSKLVELFDKTFDEIFNI